MLNGDASTGQKGPACDFTLTDTFCIYLLSQGLLLVLVGVLTAGRGVTGLEPDVIVGILLVSPLVLIVLVLIFGFARQRLNFLLERMRWQPWRQMVLWGLAAGVAARILGGFVIYIEDRYNLTPVVPNNPFVAELAELQSPLAVVLAAFAIIVLGPFAEELFYRAVMLRVLGRYLPRQPALLLGAVVFGAVHFNVGLFVPLAIAGYVLGLVYVYLESLVPAVVAHALFNAVAVFAVLFGS